MRNTRLHVAIALLCLTRDVGAQIVRGVVMLQDSVTPASGVIVELRLDGAAAPQRVLTSRTGRFNASVAASARVDMQVLRLGFRPTQLAPFVMTAADTSLRVILTSEPVLLSQVRIMADGSCRQQGANAVGIAEVWEEARKSLLATSLARDEHREASVVSWNRDVTADSTVSYQDESRARTRQPRVSRAISADSLEQFGYLIPEGETLHVFGPDPDVLLSERFLATHCFSLRAGRAQDTTRVGLAFAPARRPRVTDIAGTLWLDRRSGALQSAEFRYIALPDGLSERDSAGGRLEFVRTPDQDWFISRWMMWVPLARDRNATAASPVQHFMVGDVRTFVVAGDTVYRGPISGVTGRVRFQDDGAPVPGARVFLAGTGVALRTNDSGEFVMPEVIPGRYVIGAASRDLDSLGLARATQVVQVEAGRRAEVTVTIARTELLINELCDRVGQATGMLRGFVRDATTGAPAPGVRVTVEWLDPSDGKPRRVRQTTHRTDGTGAFGVCDVPRGWKFRVVAHRGDTAGEPAEVTLPLTNLYAVIRLSVPGAEEEAR